MRRGIRDLPWEKLALTALLVYAVVAFGMGMARDVTAVVAFVAFAWLVLWILRREWRSPS